MARADNSVRQFPQITPDDIKKEGGVPWKRLNTIFRRLQEQIHDLEGRAQPPVVRNHMTLLAPPIDPPLPPGASDQSRIFFDPDHGANLRAADPGDTSFSCLINRAGMWTNTTTITPTALLPWDTEVIGDAGYQWVASTTAINIVHPGDYLILASIHIEPISADIILDLTINSVSVQSVTVATSGRAGPNLPFHYVHRKTTDYTSVDQVALSLSSGDLAGGNGSNLVIVKVR